MDDILSRLKPFLAAQTQAEAAEKSTFKCPLCGGLAWWGRAETNGHLHTGCESCGIKIME